MQAKIPRYKPVVKCSSDTIALVSDGGIYPRIIEARTDAGLEVTQTAIAKDLGISIPAVNKWSKGAGLRLEHALEIAYKTGVTVDWLLTGRPPKKAEPESSTVSRLLKILESLPEDQQQAILNFAQFQAQSGK